MNHSFKLYNTLTRKKEQFIPLNSTKVGMYLCGPTVYGPAHLGHARSALHGDILFRYLKHLGYKVRYVRNITDVGHLVCDADHGEDKIGAQAKLEQTEPMEVAQRYTNAYRRDMRLLNIQEPSIEPQASGHITEQIAAIEKLITSGYAYISNGSVYFDVSKYKEYGKLSGRLIEDLLSSTRSLSGQQDKKYVLDFALWKRAEQAHIMRWPSPWSIGFPGWHIECSTMAIKYLGQEFDIHLGGLDLLFPHHECEIAQAVAGGSKFALYWMHNNLVMINGEKMGKSLGNSITLTELFSGTHSSLDRAYSPMIIRFLMLQSHYRSVVNFTVSDLKAAESGLLKLMNGRQRLIQMVYPNDLPEQCTEPERLQVLQELDSACATAMNDDLNTPQVLSVLFKLFKQIHMLSEDDMYFLGLQGIHMLSGIYNTWLDILGLQEPVLDGMAWMPLLQELYKSAKSNKRYDQVDKIREELRCQGIMLQDNKHGIQWGWAITDEKLINKRKLT